MHRGPSLELRGAFQLGQLHMFIGQIKWNQEDAMNFQGLRLILVNLSFDSVLFMMSCLLFLAQGIKKLTLQIRVGQIDVNPKEAQK